MQGESLDWTGRVRESMLHMAGQAWYVEGGGVKRVIPVCMLVEVCEGWTRRTHVVLRWSHLNLKSRERVRKDRIKGRESQQQKALRVDRGPRLD